MEKRGRGPRVARHRNYTRSKVQVKFLNLRRDTEELKTLHSVMQMIESKMIQKYKQTNIGILCPQGGRWQA